MQHDKGNKLTQNKNLSNKREREREREGGRETDRQTDRQTEILAYGG